MSHSSPCDSPATTVDQDHHADTQGHEGSLRSYLTGFVLAVILTIIPFWLVMGHVLLNRELTICIIMGLAAVQIAVHIIYFLHLDFRSENGWNMMAFVLTIVLLLIMLILSLWVMHDENVLMMPMMKM